MKLNNLKSIFGYSVFVLTTALATHTTIGAAQNVPLGAVGELRSVLVHPPLSSASALAPLSQADDAPLDAAAVRKAIRRSIGFLQSEQIKNGAWPDGGAQAKGGIPCLVTLALLNAGESPQSVRIQKAIDEILTYPRASTYTVSLRVMVLATADPSGRRYRASIQQDIDWLLKGQVTSGGWNYGNAGTPDGSNSQFALLALHEASKVGIAIDRKYWTAARKYWRGLASNNGGFRYRGSGSPVSGSMTSAGIASLIIIRENLFDIGAAANGAKANCCNGDDDQDQKLIDGAFAWLAKNYTTRANPVAGRANAAQQLYFLYALERAGRFAGRRFVGPHDWYRDGAKHLLSRQLASGAWKGRSGLEEDNKLVATSFALLFLSKGKRPVVIGKFDHSADQWDSHPRGLHYLTREIESAWNKKLNWQTIRAKGATPDDLLETPVLFMSGRDAIGLDDQQKKVLKDYIENGGFLFAEACQGEGCGDARFDIAFRDLMAELFPESSLEPLAPDHPIWNAHHTIVSSKERPLLGLQACCRTSVVYCPANLSCYWALSRPSVKKSKANPRLLQRVKYVTHIGVNVVAYATGRELNDKGETPKLAKDVAAVLSDRALVLPKLSHNGGADDAPNAWGKILRELRLSAGLEIKSGKTMIPAIAERLADHPFIFIHGRNKITFNAEERLAIRKYLELGGFIFADSICASDAFTDSFRFEMEQILQTRLVAIPAEHDIWTNDRYGEVLTQVTVRRKNKGGKFVEDKQAPQMDGISLNGRLAVVFSPLDLSCALENTRVSNCNGYTRQDATRIARNVVLYALLSDRVPE